MKKRTIRLIQCLFVGVLALTFLVSSGDPLPATAQTVYPFDVRDQPVYLIASYYNALALRDYARAYNYWEGHAPGGATYAQFVQGFANVQTIHALARLPVVTNGAAGTIHAEVPVVVLDTLINGTSEIFAGCFHVVRYDVPSGNPPVLDPNWHFNSAILQPATSVDFVQAASACSYVESFPTTAGYHDQLSAIDTLTSYYDAIAAHDYVRAYNYWPNGAPGQTLAQFAQGFAGTTEIGVVVGLSFQMDAAAGSAYASTPVLLTAKDWSQPQLFVGCFIARKSNVPVGNATTPDPNWYLYSANINPVGTLNAGVQQVWNACAIP
jgi:hypothetical protein